MPGSVETRMSRGCHALIRDGAKLVETVDDILEELGPLFEATISADGRTVRRAAEIELGDVERAVLDAIEATAGAASLPPSTGVSIDDVVDTSGLAASQVLATLGVLEMRRIVRRLPGNRVSRA